MTDGAWLRGVREALGLTQVELAAALHVTQATVSRIEAGLQPLTARTRSQVEAMIDRSRAEWDAGEVAAVAESP